MSLRTSIVTPREVFQKVTAASSHNESAAFNALTKVIQLVATVDTYVAIGATPVADTTGYYLVAKVPTLFGVLSGEKLSVLRVGGSDGIVSIAEGYNL